MGSQDEDPKPGMAPTVAGSVAGSVASQSTIAAGSIASQPTIASDAGPPRAPSGVEPTIASDRGQPQLTPSRMVKVQADLYQRLDELARGGLGRISRARDLRSGRIVAIKEMISSTEDAAVRFAREAMITANLEHPAIVPVYEVGRWPSGEPFFAMKLVKGRPLNVVIDEAQDLDARLALVSHVLTVADALAYAHGEKVIHRDLKPHNVLCGAHGETVVIDWGLARRIDEEETTVSLHRRISAEPGQTYVGAIMGTPAYMPPEQARGKRVDERADVYAIGAMLYHLLSGTPAYAGKTLDELIEKVRSGPPRALAELVPEVPPDLAAIVTRAMAPEPADRYPTAVELATDLRRFTTGQLVLAHRYTRGQRIQRFVSKHRGAVGVGLAAVAAILVVGTLAVVNVVRARDAAESSLTRAESETARADKERDEVRRRLIAAHTDRARVELLAQHPLEALGFVVAGAAVSGLDAQLSYLGARTLDLVPRSQRLSVDQVAMLEFIPGSTDLIVGSETEVMRWNPRTGQRLWTSPVAHGNAEPLDAQRMVILLPNGLTVVDLATGKPRRQVASPTLLGGPFGRDPTNRWLAAVSGTGLELFDLDAGVRVASIPVPALKIAPLVSPDGERFAVRLDVSDVQERMVLIDRTGRALRELCGNCTLLRRMASGFVVAEYRPGQPSHALMFDWNGKLLHDITPASVSELVEIVKAPTGDDLALLTADGMIEMHALGKGLRWRQTISDRPYEARFDARGRLWVMGAYNSARVYDVATGVELGTWALGGVALRVSDDGSQVAIGTFGLGVTSWPPSVTRVESIAPSDARVRKVLFVDDKIVTASDDGGLAVFEDGKPPRELGRHGARIPSIEITSSGAVMSSSRDGTTVIRELATGRELERYPLGPHAAVSSDGVHLAIGGTDGTVTLIDRKTKATRVLTKLPVEVSAIRWAPDGTKLGVIDNDGNTVVSSVEGTKLKEVAGIGFGIDLVFSNDGRWVLRTGKAGQHILYSMTPGVADRVLDEASSFAITMNAVFSQDDRYLALAQDQTLRVFDLSTQTIATTISTGTQLLGLAFAPDNSLIYGGGVDRKVRAWDLPGGITQAELPVVGEVYGLAFDARRSRLAITTLGPAMLWNLPPLTLDLPHLRALVSCLDERDVVTGATHRIDLAACNQITAP